MDDDPYLEAATKLHPRKRPVSQSRKTGFLSVDALRERLSNNLPTKDRLSIAQASRQMEILLSRLSAPQEPPVLSAKAKNRVRKNHEASVALHVDRTRAKERTKQEALDKSNFQIFGNYAKEHPMQTTKQEHHHRKENHSDAFHRHIVQKNNYLNDMKNTSGGSYNNDTSLRPQDGYDDVNDNWIKCRTRGDPEKFYFHNILTGESRWILDENILNKSRRQHQQHQQQQQQPHDGHHTKGYSTMLEKSKDDDDNVKKSDEFEVGFKGIRTNVQNNRLKSAPRGGRRDMGDGRRNRDGVGEDGRDFARRELYRPMSSPANLSRSNRKSEIVDFDLGVGNDIVYEDTDDSSTDDDKEYDQYNRRKIIDVRIGDRNGGGGGGRNDVRRERGENDENVEKSAMSPPRINQQNNPQNRSPSPQRSKSPLKKTNKKKNANMMTANERRKYVKELKDAEEEANKQKNKQRKQSKEEKEGKKRLAMLQSKSFSLFVDRRRAPKEREAQILERQAQMKASAPPPIPPENKRLPQPIKEQLVGDEEKSGSGLVSDWLKIPEVSRTLLEKKRLAIVVACYDGSTSFNHPCVYERYKNSANSVINVIKEFTDDCAGISGYSIVEKGDVAGSLEIYAAIHSEVSVPLPAAPLVTTDASKRMGTSPSTYPHLVATRASATIMKTQPIKPPVERNIHTKLLFSKKLAGGWPDPKRCRRKLKRWLKKDVGIDISSIAHFRAREAEKAMTDHVHINFPIQYLANWVKILDVPWNDGVRFEYEGPREEEEEKEEEGGEGNVDKNDPNRVPLIEREGHDENNHNEKDDLIINGDKKGHHQTSPSKKNQKNKIGDKKRLTLKELKKNRKSKAKSSEQSDIKADRKGKMTKDDDEEEYKAPFRVGGPLKHDDLHYFKNYSSSEEEEEVDEDGNVTRKSRKGPKEKIAKLMYKWRGAAHVVTAFNKKREYHLATTSDVLHQQHDLDKLTDEATKQSERAASSITNPVDGVLGDQMPVPTRTVHTCIIPRNVKHLLMGCADGVAPSSSSSQDPTQTMNDKLAICAIAPPYHCFQSCENETESRQYRGVRWHCRAPSMKDSGFGHDFGFSNSNEVVIEEGRGDVWFSSNVVEFNDNRKECSGERSGGGLIDDGVTLSYSVDDKKTASLVDYEYVDEQEMKEILDEVTLFSPFGAVSRPLKNANRPKEFQRFKEHQIFVQQQQKQFEEQLAQQTSSITDQMGDNKSSSKIEEILPDNRNPRYLSQTKDSSWDRMSWGGAGGGRCGEPISDLHAPSHPWEIGTQVQMLQSAGVFSEGQIVIVMEYHINASSSSVHEKINQSPTDKRQTQNDINAKEDEKRNVAFEEVKKPSSSSLSSPILTPNKYIYHMKSEDGSFDWLAASDHGTLFRLQNFHDIRFEGLRKVIYIRLPDQLILPDEVNLEELRIENRRLQIEQEQEEAEVNITQDVVGIAEKVSPVLLETSLPFSSSPLPQSSINSHMLPSVQSIEKKKELNVELVKSPESTQGEDPSYENDFYFEDTYEEDFASKQRQHQNDVEEKHEVKQDQHQQEDKENDDIISIKQQQQQQGQKLDNDLKEERAATTIQCNTRKQQAKQEVNKIWMNHQVEVARKEQEREQLVLKERERKLNLQLEAQEACSQAAIMIQALLRQYKEKLRYSQERKAIILIQRIARQRQARKFVNNKQEEKKSAVVIQGMFRQKKAKETVKYKKEVKIQNSAIKIQSLYGQKNSKIKMQNKRKEKAANKIQNAARIKQAKKEIRRKRLEKHEKVVVAEETVIGSDPTSGQDLQEIRHSDTSTLIENVVVNEDQLLRTVGSVVEVRYRARFSWYRGVITKAYYDGSVDVTYDDGDTEVGVPRIRVRLVGQQEPGRLEPGTRVEARYNNGKQTYGGVIVNMWGDGENYMIEYDDGDKEARVHRSLIYAKCVTVDVADDTEDLSRAAIKIQSSFRGHHTKKAYNQRQRELKAQQIKAEVVDQINEVPLSEEEILRTVSSVVEVRYRARFSWYRGVITKAYYDGSVDVKYDDGDTEVGVPRIRVRLVGQQEPGRLEPGTRVEARYNNGKQTYGGVIVNMWGDGENYMIEYDDGDKEARVHRSLIYAKCVTTTEDDQTTSKDTEDGVTELSPTVPMLSNKKLTKSGKISSHGLSFEEETLHGLIVTSGIPHHDVVESESGVKSSLPFLSHQPSNTSLSQYTKDFMAENTTNNDSSSSSSSSSPSSSTTQSLALKMDNRIQRQPYHQLISPLTNPSTPNYHNDEYYEPDFLNTTAGSSSISPLDVNNGGSVGDTVRGGDKSTIYEPDFLNVTSSTMPVSPIHQKVRSSRFSFDNNSPGTENQTVYEKDFLNTTGGTTTMNNEDNDTIYEKDFLNVTSGSVPSCLVESSHNNDVVQPPTTNLMEGRSVQNESSEVSISVSKDSPSVEESGPSSSSDREVSFSTR